jgi:hypothetical protein
MRTSTPSRPLVDIGALCTARSWRPWARSAAGALALGLGLVAPQAHAQARPSCPAPSLSGLRVFETQVVGGTQQPPQGVSPLVQSGGSSELRITWMLDPQAPPSNRFGTLNLPLRNRGQFTDGIEPRNFPVDLGAAAGLDVRYASTGPVFVQLRTGSVPNGGDHFRADLPVTGGQLRALQLPFASFRRPGGNTPPGPEITRDAFSFTFATTEGAALRLTDVSVPGLQPPCD